MTINDLIEDRGQEGYDVGFSEGLAEGRRENAAKHQQMYEALGKARKVLRSKSCNCECMKLPVGDDDACNVCSVLYDIEAALEANDE